MEELKIAFIQTELYWESQTANRKLFEKHLSSMSEQTDVIVLPEMFTTGFTMNASANAESLSGETLQWMGTWSAKMNCVITGSIIIAEDGKYFNRLIWMRADRSFETYDKHHLFRLSGEEKIYSSGKKKLIVELKGWRICPLICYDLRFPVWSRRKTTEDYDVLLYVANWPERRVGAWKHLLPARAIENQAYVIGVNRIGNDGNGISHTGESAIFDFKGEEISNSEANSGMIETVSLSHAALTNFRKSHPFELDADEFELLK